MPYLQIFSNLLRSQIPKNLGSLAAKTLSQTLPGKAPNLFCVHISTDNLSYAGWEPESPESPTVYAIFRAIRTSNLDENRLIASALTDLLHKELNIPAKEIRIFFNDFSTDMVSIGGKMVTDSRPKK